MATPAADQRNAASAGRRPARPNPDFGQRRMPPPQGQRPGVPRQGAPRPQGQRPSGQRQPGQRQNVPRQNGQRPNGQRPNYHQAPNRTVHRGGAAVKKKSNAPVIALVVLLLLIAVIAAAYGVGFLYYRNRFTANTFVNGVAVGGKTLEEAEALFEHKEVPSSMQVTTPSENVIDIPLNDVDYRFNYPDELSKIMNDIDKKSWFVYLMRKTDYSFNDVSSFDKTKLFSEIESADWGNAENANAEIKSGDEGYYIIPEVQGDVFDMAGLENYLAGELENNVYNVNSVDSGAYVRPDTVEEDLEKKVETLNKFWNMEINYDFNYTKEKLTGKTLAKLVKVKRDGSYEINDEAIGSYIEKLQDKYDTYGKDRKFKSTLQGKITVKWATKQGDQVNSDSIYGWWLDYDKSCDQLKKMIEKGENRKKVTPIYYTDPNGFIEYTGVPEARTKDDDIGKTYIEVDLTNQQWWYYKKGKKKRHGYIVSGQTTSYARTTLEGLYKIVDKDVNHKMKDRNADGEEWDTTCNYWNRISDVGIGMHDSTWRGGAFGGDIYKWNGSHGCINMSYDDAQYIYENVPIGTPVVMFY